MPQFNFVYDRDVDDRPYPNLIPVQDLTNDYSHMWHDPPHIIPSRLEQYCQQLKFPNHVYSIYSDLPQHSFYSIGLGIWRPDIDYVGLISDTVLNRVRSGDLKLLFYSHEADDVVLQKTRMDFYCARHCVPKSGYIFVTGNARVRRELSLDNFYYFPDHELFYKQANQEHRALPAHSAQRGRDFTCLSRIHKSWRCSAMTHLYRSGLLDNSYWSYQKIDAQELTDEINFAAIPGGESGVQMFLENAPYHCDGDSLDLHQQAQHNRLVIRHHVDSYINIVFETLFVQPQAFLTEKTFKPIKHGQPFVIVGAKHTLKLLRNLGYRVFDNVINNAYDDISDPTKRWLAIYDTLRDIKSRGCAHVYDLCRDDIAHNQKFFMDDLSHRLLNLYHDITA